MTTRTASAREWTGTARRGAQNPLAAVRGEDARRQGHRPLRSRLADTAAVIGVCALTTAGLRLGDLLHVLAPHALGR